MKLRNIPNEILRKVVLFFGQIRHISSPPFFTWDHHHPRVGHDEIDYIETIIQPGDIGLHLDEGFFSNLVIPGEYKHCWLFTGGTRIVEAIGEGVVERSLRYPCRTDKLLILRPQLPKEIREQAVTAIRNTVGMKYDHTFKFDLEEEFTNLNKYDQSFSCIELVLYAYYESMAQLGVQKTRYFGRDIYRPDAVVTVACDIVYKHDGKQRVHPGDNETAVLSAAVEGPETSSETPAVEVVADTSHING